MPGARRRRRRHKSLTEKAASIFNALEQIETVSLGLHFQSDSEAAHPLIYLVATNITASNARMIAICAVSP
jgi:hypothetical protein